MPASALKAGLSMTEDSNSTLRVLVSATLVTDELAETCVDARGTAGNKPEAWN